MPHFAPDLTKASVALEVFSKGDYEFIVGEPKSFQRTNDKGQETYGVRWQLTLAEDTNGYRKGAKQFYSGYLHSDGAHAFVKMMVMACLGFNPRSKDDERKFDSEFQGGDWSIDTETNGVGDVYRRTTGKRVVASLDVQPNPNTGEASQRFNGFRPVGA